jgi:D-alanine-D-alanine ligase
MNRSKHVCVLMGGWSAERQQSVKSGRACGEVLEKQGFRVTRVDVGRDIANVLQVLKPDAVLNVVHGRPGRDGRLQGVLETIGVPYSHSGLLATALAAHHSIANVLLRAAGVPVVDGLADTGSPVAAAPARTFACALMGETALAVAELLPNTSPEVNSPQNGNRCILPAPVSPNVYQEVRRLALAAHRALGCRGVSRAEFRFESGAAGTNGLVCVEIDPQPGMTETSLVPEIAGHAGVSFDELVRWMVEDASLGR